MKRTPFFVVIFGFCLLGSATSCTHPAVPDGHARPDGRPVRTRASHPAGGSMLEVKGGAYLGRRYFTPPGSKSGLQWIDVYES